MLFIKKRIPAEYGKEQIRIIKDYEYLNTYANEGKTVLIGDDLSYRYPVSELFPFRVYGRGLPGDDAKRMISRIDNNCLSIDPRSVIILTGSTELRYGLSAKEITDNVWTIVEKLLSGNDRRYIYVTSVLATENVKNANNIANETNKNLLDLSKKTKRVRFVDLSEQLNDDNGFVKTVFKDDDMQLNVHAYSIITKKLLENMNYNPAPSSKDK